jgi:nondiscriminating glutamyl-tRNA synthetase
MKSDGFPTYHLGVVVDDHDMGITHVIRGDEWIPSTPLHILMYNAFGWSIPEFVHLPLVVDSNGQKLKKRTPEFEVGYYQDKGYLPEAVVNALALMGWNPGTGHELLSPHEIIELFNISHLSSSPSIFDEERLRTFSREHIARLDLADLASRILPLICEAYPEANSHNQSWLLSLVSVIREELSTLNDAIEAARFAFRPTPRTPEAHDALMGECGRLLLETAQARLSSLPRLTPENTSALFKEMRVEFKESHNLNAQAVMFPLRAALSGSITGPHLSDIVTLLGKAETLQRIEHALAELP